MGAATILAGLGVAGAAVLLFMTGANDVANALGTSVGSRALTLKQACVVAAVFEMLGASIVGGSVASTLGDGIAHKCQFASPVTFVACMLSALVSAAMWIAVATKYALPVSSTHAIIGGVVAGALVDGGAGAVGGPMLLLTAVSWVTSPLLGGLASALVYWGSRRLVLNAPYPEQRSEQAAPFLIGGTVAVLVFFVMLGVSGASVLRDIPWWGFLLLFLGMFFVCAVIAKLLVVPRVAARMDQHDRAVILERASTTDRYSNGETKETLVTRNVGIDDANVNLEEKDESTSASNNKTSDDIDALNRTFDAAEMGINEQELASSLGESPSEPATSPALPSNHSQRADRWFILPMVMTACCVSFAHGGNDIANAIGPLSELLLFATTGSLDGSSSATVTLWYVTPLGGIFIVLGLSIYGKNVMKTVGSGITTLTYSKGFAAQFGAAIAVLFATVLGMPISTTAVLIGSIAGVGISDGQGRKSVDLKTVGKIVAGWIVTLPIAGALSAIIFVIVRAFLGEQSGWDVLDPRSNCTLYHERMHILYGKLI
jgi:phosphate/sulfate permease